MLTLVSAQAENELQRMILRGVAQGARISNIARCRESCSGSDLFQGARPARKDARQERRALTNRIL
jgi:hypothetical protein